MLLRIADAVAISDVVNVSHRAVLTLAVSMPESFCRVGGLSSVRQGAGQGSRDAGLRGGSPSAAARASPSESVQKAQQQAASQSYLTVL